MVAFVARSLPAGRLVVPLWLLCKAWDQGKSL